MEMLGVEYCNDKLVSIIMPAHNSEKYIAEALDSIIAQSYHNWEAIVINDCSTDNTEVIIQEYTQKDKRIRTYHLEKRSGPAQARNTAIDLAAGDFLAFLDSDDLWKPNKLKEQISFMSQNDIFFTCTSYQKIDEEGKLLNRIIKAKNKYDYEALLKECPGNSTVVYNAAKLGKFKIPNIRKRNDYLMWLQVIKKAGYLHGINQVLSSHRVRKNSISSNKISLIIYHWKVYREYEGLSLFKSIYLVAYWIIATLFKLR